MPNNLAPLRNLGGVAAVFLVVRFAVFRGAGGDLRLGLFVVYAVVSLLVLGMGEGGSARKRLLAYLEAHHRHRWRELTAVPLFGPGGRNDFRLWPFLFSGDDLGDPQVGPLKAAAKWQLVCALGFVYVAFPVVFLVAVVA